MATRSKLLVLAAPPAGAWESMYTTPALRRTLVKQGSLVNAGGLAITIFLGIRRSGGITIVDTINNLLSGATHHTGWTHCLMPGDELMLLHTSAGATLSATFSGAELVET